MRRINADPEEDRIGDDMLREAKVAASREQTPASGEREVGYAEDAAFQAASFSASLAAYWTGMAAAFCHQFAARRRERSSLVAVPGFVERMLQNTMANAAEVRERRREIERQRSHLAGLFERWAVMGGPYL